MCSFIDFKVMVVFKHMSHFFGVGESGIKQYYVHIINKKKLYRFIYASDSCVDVLEIRNKEVLPV